MIAGRLNALTGTCPLLVLVSPGYRTFGDQCGRLLCALVALRDCGTLLFAEASGSGQRLYQVPTG